VNTAALPGEAGVADAQVGARRAVAFDELASRLRAEPGVTHVTFGDRLPGMSPELIQAEVVQEGGQPERVVGNYDGRIASATVGNGYHEAFGSGLVLGRALEPSDETAANRPVLVNGALMRKLGANPVGARIRIVEVVR
jgi:hypothetical protein